MDILIIEANPVEYTLNFLLITYSLFMLAIGLSPALRVAAYELAAAVFDSNGRASKKEKEEITSPALIAAFLCLATFLVAAIALTIKAAMFSWLFMVVVLVFVALRRQKELKRDELAELGQTQL